MEQNKEGTARISSSNGGAEPAPTRPGMSTSAAMERAEAAYFEYCPMEPPSTRVGTNHLVVDNILRYCDADTIQACTRVNHLWRNLAIPSAHLMIVDADKKRTKQQLKPIGNLKPFTNLTLYHVNIPRNWIRYSPNLVALEIRHTLFNRSKDLRKVVFNSFPCLKKLQFFHIYIENKHTLRKIQMPTPKLESLIVECPEELPNHHFITRDFCLKVIANLRNLKILHIDAPDSPYSIPLFGTLTKANIKLEDLTYQVWDQQKESLAVIKKYFRVCGEPLRRLCLAFLSSRKILRGFPGQNLHYLELTDGNCNLTLNKDANGVFKLSVKVSPVRDFPNISEVSFRGTYDDFPQQFPSIESPVSGSLSVDDVRVVLNGSEYQVDEESRQARYLLFVLFPNVLHLRLDGGRNYDGVVDLVKEAGRNWPHLRSLSVTGWGYEGWNCEKWRNVIAHVVQNLRDLEDVSFLDEHTQLDSSTMIQFLLLPKLKRLYVKKLKIPSQLLDMLKNHVSDFEATVLTLED